MSKIQEALRRIQAGKDSVGSALLSPDISEAQDLQRTSTDDSLIVAKLIERNAEGSTHPVGEPFLHVDHEALREAGLIAPDYHEHLLANQYRDIKRPLIAHAFGKRATQIESGNLIMVSSAVPGEGKTFTSINLALSMAQERDHEVLLVDADVAKPHTSEMFGASDEKGLLDLLEDPSIPIESLILPTDVDGLSILPAGRPRHSATELLASAAMEQVVATLSQRSKGQIVIFDSPPLLLTSEAKVLSDFAGQVVIVVSAESTPQDAVEAALALLDENKAVNLVLNQIRAGFRQYQYGYGYGYQERDIGEKDDRQ